MRRRDPLPLVNDYGDDSDAKTKHLSIILILPQPSAQLITLTSTLIIPNITGTSSNNCL